MGKKLSHYIVDSLPIEDIDTCAIYYIKEEGETTFKMYIRNYENDFWIDNGSPYLIEWENIMNKPDTVLGYNITDGATINDVSWGDKQW